MAIEAKRNGTKVITGEVRLSYVNLFVPKATGDNPTPKYSCMLLVPKTDKKTIKAIREAQQVALENGKSSKFGGKIPKNWKDTFRDGDEEYDTDEYPEMEGMMFLNVSANEAYPPNVVDRRLQPILDQTEVYSGCYARVSINAFPFSAQGNKGVSFGINNVQKLRDGEALGGVAARAEDDFEKLDDLDDDDLL